MATIADEAARLLRARNAGTRPGWGAWTLDCGMLDDLHDIYRAARAGAPATLPFERGARAPRAVRERRAVMEALARTARGRELFDCETVTGLYPGIVNGASRVFTLKPEHRS